MVERENPWVLALRHEVSHVTGHFLLLMRELSDVDCAREIGRRVVRWSVLRNWHWQIVAEARLYQGRADPSYLDKLLAQEIVCPVTIFFDIYPDYDAFVDTFCRSGFVRQGTVMPGPRWLASCKGTSFYLGNAIPLCFTVA